MSKLPAFRFNKRISLFLFVILGFISINVHAQNKRPILTNDDVIRMTKEKLKESIILSAIESSEANFDISANGLIQLQRGKVKKGIIATIIKIQSNKNKGYIVTRDAPVTKIEDAGVGSNSAPDRNTSASQKRHPIATRDASLFTIELKRCEISSTTIVCYFAVTNKGQDRVMSLNTYGSTLVDLAGNTSKLERYKLGSIESTIGGKPINILSNAKIDGAMVVFDKVELNLELIGRLTIGFYVRGEKDFFVEFRNVPIEKASRESISDKIWRP